ncbi:MAG: hypothetical protein Q9221_000142 [Calogaya cf. arnoldii]
MTATSLSPSWEQPSHPKLIKVHRIAGAYQSYSTSLVSLPAGSLFSPIKNHSFIKDRAFSSVEAANGMHIDLNSDLFYANHSYAPSLEYDVGLMEVRVSRDRDLHEGDVLSFFYPSTEWHMAQPFECSCHDSACLGTIMGASGLGKARVNGYWLNKHIIARLENQDDTKTDETPRGAGCGEDEKGTKS